MNGVDARRIMENAVRRELVGPIEEDGPSGTPLDCAQGVVAFKTKEESRGRFHEATSGQEILTRENPLRRYGVGVLFSEATTVPSTPQERRQASENLDGVIGLSSVEESLNEDASVTGEPIREAKRPVRGALDDDLDLTDANGYKPSAMAISFECRIVAGSSLDIDLTAAQYVKVIAHIPEVAQPRDWWLRKPFQATATVGGNELLTDGNTLVTPSIQYHDEKPSVRPSIEVFTRPVPGEEDPALRIVTVALVNRSGGKGPERAIFQAGFQVTPRNGAQITAYHEAEHKQRDDEEQSLDLLYRRQRTYAIGHGCAASWDSQNAETPQWVATEAMPAYEVESLTPDIFTTDEAGNRVPVVVSMRELALGSTTGSTQVEKVIHLYEEWIKAQEAAIPELPIRMHTAAEKHICEARTALRRIREGWKLVGSDEIANRAFRWANEAMLFQQIRSSLGLRELKEHGKGKNKYTAPDGEHPAIGSLEAVKIPAGKGTWRPFQIAFILASLPELVNPHHANRDLVDLIFFPTGGGKTEAYLGAAAVSLLSRRLRNPRDAGTDTIMRYTLRLLTAQQFLRAASLVCVLEELRSRSPEHVKALGSTPFSIGIWLGGSSTPNTWDQADRTLTSLQRDVREQNKFLLLRCPWCGTQMGPIGKGGKHGQVVAGYEKNSQKKVVFCCVDDECHYSQRPLPVQVVDAGIYENPPSIVIGTVDKFAMLAWKPEARALFGLGPDGKREDVSPPSLILQDELHLISGPLGSMVGMYEAIINDLCTDHRDKKNPVPPKIIAATATIRRYKDQVKNLYGRDDVALFPPHGLEEGRSFFAEPDRNLDGTPKPGRRYLGVMSATLGSLQTVQVRVAAATVLGRHQIPDELTEGNRSPRDGYWTNLNFLNSLRELGNTLSLLESDIPDYLNGIRNRGDKDFKYPGRYMELTSRRRSDEIPKAIEELQVSYGDDRCIDVCLASNIIEVGVDINRLGLMTIIGQPKTTAQYIQVSGRVGRRPDISPGLVITLYGAAKPRDRSHYERFRTYHQQLYAQVEPTSVTPFATPVLRRALHGAVIAYIRQTSDAERPHPFPAEEYWEAVKILEARAESIAKTSEMETGDVKHLRDQADLKARQWQAGGRSVWDANPGYGGDPDNGLIRYAGILPEVGREVVTWDTPSSMRTVDAECRLAISNVYAENDHTLQQGGMK